MVVMRSVQVFEGDGKPFTQKLFYVKCLCFDGGDHATYIRFKNRTEKSWFISTTCRIAYPRDKAEKLLAMVDGRYDIKTLELA